MAGIVATGQEPALGQFSPDSEEMTKRLTAYLMAGDRIVMFDNVSCTIGGDAFCAALTGTIWNGRILGLSKNWEGPINSTFYATSNNARLGADMDRRVCLIRLSPSQERPEERTGFKHDPLLSVVRQRPDLTVAALTILRAFFAAGCPKGSYEPWGSFEDWARVVLGACVFAGLPDPGANRELVREADSEGEHRTAFVAWVRISTSNGAKSTREMFGAMDLPTDTIRALCHLRGEMKLTALHVGNLLRKFKGRTVGNWRIVAETDTHTKQPRWKAEPPA